MTEGVSARLDRIESELVVLKDREAIRDIIYRYCRAVDRADTELLKSCYWPDGFDDHGFFGGNAWEFSEFATPLLRITNATTHSCSNPIIELDGPAAYCETQVDVIHRLADSASQVYEWVQCRYLDIFEKRGGEWRILVRTATRDGAQYIKMSTELFAIRGRSKPENALPSGARHPDDPVYQLRNLRNLVKTRTPVTDFWSGLRAVKHAM
jgi:ketosteroid isomerase-like protein